MLKLKPTNLRILLSQCGKVGKQGVAMALLIRKNSLTLALCTIKRVLIMGIVSSALYPLNEEKFMKMKNISDYVDLQIYYRKRQK